MPDIYISCDCNHWYESGPCRNLEIFNNIFSKKDSVKIEPINRLKMFIGTLKYMIIKLENNL